MLTVSDSQRPSSYSRAVHAVVGAFMAAAASFAATCLVIHPDLGGLGAIGGFFVGALGGALARAKTYQVAITATLWGALLGPVVGLLLLVVLLAIAGVGM